MMRQKHIIKDNKIIKITVLWSTAVIVFILTAFRPIGIDNDSVTYQNAILNYYKGDIDIKEPVFLLYCYISKYFFYENVRSVFVMYALPAIIIKFYAIQRYSANIILSLLVYIGMFFILHDMTQIRVGLAASFFLLAMPDLIKGDKRSYLFKIGVAILCHFSAVILLPLIFISVRKINYPIIILSPIIMLFLVLIIKDINPVLLTFFHYLPEPLATKGITYTIGAQEHMRFSNVNVFSKITLSSFSFFLLYVFVTYKVKSRAPEDIFYLKIFSIMLTVYYLFSSVPVLASRSFELFSVSFIFSFPLIIKKIKPYWIVCLFFSCWVCLYFYVVNLKLLGI